ncbi:MAG: ATP-grasp domain-containing protein [Bowdeniella nasicola]|nr:ATP-grasp domain-containing protein [Bowdeniella nasicola]
MSHTPTTPTTSETTLVILGASAVQADAIHAAHRLGYRVLVTGREGGPACQHADAVHLIDFTDLPAMRELVRTHSPAAVYSVGSDLAMPIAARLAAECDLPIFASEDTARACNAKPEMRERTAACPGAVAARTVRVPQRELIDAAEGCPLPRHRDGSPDVGFPGPWIVKPADAQGQRGIVKVERASDLAASAKDAASFSRTGRAIIERFVGGTEVSVNGYLVDGELTFFQISDRETWPEHTGLIRAHVVPSRYSNDPALSSAVRTTLESFCLALGLHNGPVYAQVKVERGTPYVIEVTPRLDGCHMWHLLHYACGVDLLTASLTHLLTGKPPRFEQECTPVAHTLTFHCQEPGTPARYPAEFGQGERVRATCRYYRSGATIRPVNGVLEKIGYTITQQDDPRPGGAEGPR